MSETNESHFVLGCVATPECGLAVLLQLLGLDPLFLLLDDKVVLLQLANDFFRLLLHLPAQGFLVSWLSLPALERDEVIFDLWPVGRDGFRSLHSELEVLQARTTQGLLKGS